MRFFNFFLLVFLTGKIAYAADLVICEQEELQYFSRADGSLAMNVSISEGTLEPHNILGFYISGDQIQNPLLEVGPCNQKDNISTSSYGWEYEISKDAILITCNSTNQISDLNYLATFEISRMTGQFIYSKYGKIKSLDDEQILEIRKGICSVSKKKF